jgi:hypothetical protein
MITAYHYAGRDFLTLTLNLGRGGMKIKTHQHLSEDESLKFNLVLGQSPIPLIGRIVYCQFLPESQYVAGIQFVNVPSQAEKALVDYLAVLDDGTNPKDSVST